MTRSETIAEQNARTLRFVDKLVWSSIPVLFACFGWVIAHLIEIDKRVTVIESNRYTTKDAADDRENTRERIEMVRSQLPPQLFYDKFDELVDAVREVRGAVQDSTGRLIVIESRLSGLEERSK